MCLVYSAGSQTPGGLAGRSLCFASWLASARGRLTLYLSCLIYTVPRCLGNALDGTQTGSSPVLMMSLWAVVC